MFAQRERTQVMSTLFRLSVASTALRVLGRSRIHCSVASWFSGRSTDHDLTNYGEVKADIDKWVSQLRSHPDRYQSIEQREDRSDMSLKTHYKTG